MCVWACVSGMCVGVCMGIVSLARPTQGESGQRDMGMCVGVCMGMCGNVKE